MRFSHKTIIIFIALLTLFINAPAVSAIDLLQLDHTPPAITANDLSKGSVLISITSEGFNRARILYVCQDQLHSLAMIKSADRFSVDLPLESIVSGKKTSTISYSFQVDRIRGGLATSRRFVINEPEPQEPKNHKLEQQRIESKEILNDRLETLERIERLLVDEEISVEEKARQITIARLHLVSVLRRSKTLSLSNKPSPGPKKTGVKNE